MTYYFELKEMFSLDKMTFNKGFYKTDDVEFLRKYQGVLFMTPDEPKSFLDFDQMRNKFVTFN